MLIKRLDKSLKIISDLMPKIACSDILKYNYRHVRLMAPLYKIINSQFLPLLFS